jgi:DNA-binding beta-propeller fold protein YncE
MKQLRRVAFHASASILLFAAPALAQQTSPLKLLKTVNLPGYTGDFDHSAYDAAHGRILIAAEDHGTLEVFDANTGDHLRTVKGFDVPHSILIRPGSPTIFVTDSGPSMSKLVDSNSYEKKAAAPLLIGADSMGYSSEDNIAYVVTGGDDQKMDMSQLEAVDPNTGKKLGSVKFDDSHVEAMAVEKGGNRIFINLTAHNSLAVVNRKSMTIQAIWKITSSHENAMVAMDEQQHRLYVVCRKPGMVVVLDSDTGKVITTQPAPFHSDDVMLDTASHRLYVPGVDGFLGIYDTSDPNHLQLKTKVRTAVGGKTGLLMPQQKKLMIIASPGDTKAMAKVLFYSIQ